MRLWFVVDGRSPIALNWIAYFVERGDEVHLVSTFACNPQLSLASLHVLSVAFSGMRKPGEAHGPPSRHWGKVGLRTKLRQWLGPLTLPGAGRRLGKIIASMRPDLVHAMRIPYEGMVAALAQPAMPLLVSVWGNDFTLHARATPLMASYTRRALNAADALHADCRRDARLALAWGFPDGRPVLVVPGNGGLQLDRFYPPSAEANAGQQAVEEEGILRVINPRGLRAYVRNDTFFRSVPLVIQSEPRARFLCTTMAGEPEALRWLDELRIDHVVELLPMQTRSQMAELFRRALVAVSPSTHDGTPNTLLEAMACGCFPVAGDIESLREWITPGVNGLLVDPADPQALAEAILTALRQPELRQAARQYNLGLVAEKAEYGRVMAQAASFYQGLI